MPKIARSLQRGEASGVERHRDLLTHDLTHDPIPSLPAHAVFPLHCHHLMGKANPLDALTPAELRKLRSLKDPHGIQKYIDDMPYHLADTGWSPRKVLKEETSHCFEGAMLAAAALRAIGHPPLIFDLEAEHDTDHVVAIYKINNHWGSIAKSNYTGCRYREPVYRTLRELAMSYFDTYFNLRRERTLRRFSVPVHMKRFDHLDWMTTDRELWFVAEYLFDIRHFPLISKTQARNLHRLDDRSFRAGCLGRAEKKKQ